MHTLPLSGQVALATSGSRGPGREFAQALTAVGAAVAVLSRHRDDLKPVGELLKAHGATANPDPQVFLASDAPSFMTGEVTVMDGGYSLF
jgi:NADP-dependent 3-hydroxy acid dehydrogenase YdfG